MKGLAVAAAVVAGAGAGSGVSAEGEKIGLLIGYNTAAMNVRFSSFDNQVNWTRRGSFSSSFGYHMGAYVAYPLSEIELSGIPYSLGVDPTVLFFSKGGKYSGGITATRPGLGTFPGYYEISAYYADVLVPLSFQRDFSSYTVKVGVGPFVSVGLFGEQKYTVPGNNEIYTQSTFHPQEGLERVDAGIIASVGVEFAETVSIAIRYGSGFWDESVTSYNVTLGFNIKR